VAGSRGAWRRAAVGPLARRVSQLDGSRCRAFGGALTVEVEFVVMAAAMRRRRSRAVEASRLLLAALQRRRSRAVEVEPVAAGCVLAVGGEGAKIRAKVSVPARRRRAVLRLDVDAHRRIGDRSAITHDPLGRRRSRPPIGDQTRASRQRPSPPKPIEATTHDPAGRCGLAQRSARSSFGTAEVPLTDRRAVAIPACILDLRSVA
jgi:hypothetical protein